MQKSILITDDQYVIRTILKKILSNTSYQVLEANNGVNALKILVDDDSIFCIVLDIAMPGMDGIETAVNIRKLLNHKSTPILFCTSIKQDDIVIPPNVTNYDFINKPFNQEAVLEFITKYERQGPFA